MKTFFDPYVAEIMRSVDNQIHNSGVSVRSAFSSIIHRLTLFQYLLLVGGFGESRFLRQELKNRYEAGGCEVNTTNDSTYVKTEGVETD